MFRNGLSKWLDHKRGNFKDTDDLKSKIVKKLLSKNDKDHSIYNTRGIDQILNWSLILFFVNAQLTGINAELNLKYNIENSFQESKKIVEKIYGDE